MPQRKKGKLHFEYGGKPPDVDIIAKKNIAEIPKYWIAQYILFTQRYYRKDIYECMPELLIKFSSVIWQIGPLLLELVDQELDQCIKPQK